MGYTKTRQATVPELWQIYDTTRDVDIRNELIRRYGELVRCIALKVVGRYRYFNYMEDIVSEGLIALLDSVQRFDRKKNVKFETFASIKIRGAMIDYIRKQDCFPRRLKKMAKAINEADEQLNQKMGRTPTEQEIADFLHVSQEEYGKMLAETCSLNMLSFEEILYEKGVENIGLSPAGEIGGPEQEMAEKELQKVLEMRIDELEEKERTVISLYYKEQLKIKEIASILGISDSRVSQIHSGALRKLKKGLEEYLKL